MRRPIDDATKEKLITDFNAVVADAEALLNATANQSGEKMAEVRAKTEESLRGVKSRLADAQAALRVKSKAAARATDEYVYENPWKAVGIAAGVGAGIGLVIGLFIDRC